MDGNSVHAYKLVNSKGEVHYVKFRWKTLQGIKNLDPQQVEQVQGKDYSHMTNDLVAAIRRGDYPKWDLYIQVLKPEELKTFDFDPLDATKIWPDVPEKKIGQMVLNKNTDNVFQETEQVAMAPSSLVPGIEPSEDKLLQGRLFAYADTQIYRIGSNGLSLPVNRPLIPVNNGNQDGTLNSGHTLDKGVNYQPSRLYPREELASARYSQTPLEGTTQQSKIQREQNFRQTGELYRSYSKKEQDDLVNSLGTALAGSDNESKNIMLSYFYKADKEYGTRLTSVAKGDLSRVQKLADKLSD
ncbi:catalase HPII [Salmonella enterica subsp. indica]|uniref:Catalase n=2 Tax=Salmonella enterica TaxID=28901 RepID=A0A379YMK4_SALER|nr:catalase HPII [Salmonella enterica subsp. indica]